MAQEFGQRVLTRESSREIKILRGSVLQHFPNLRDPRVKRTQHHSLVSIVSQSGLRSPKRLMFRRLQPQL